MLHRVSRRRERYAELAWCWVVLMALCLGLMVFYLLTAPNWDIPLLSAAAVAVLLLPLYPLLTVLFGERTLQVEHAGVVLIESVWGRGRKRSVWQADQVRGFDWERDADGCYRLRLLLQETPLHRPQLLSVLHTPSPYAFAAIWRDLELHYPGSGLREAPPATDAERARSSRAVALAALLAGLALLWLARPALLTPLHACAAGQVTAARIVSLEWDSPARGSTYHLRVSAGDKVLRSASAFPQSALMPRPGQSLPVLPAGQGFFYLPDEVLPFLVPLLLGSGAALLIVLGALGLRPVNSRV